MNVIPKELIKIRDRVAELNSGIPYSEISYGRYLEDSRKFDYIAVLPAYKPVAELILKEILENLDSIENKKYKIFDHINHLLTIDFGIEGGFTTLDYSTIEEFYNFCEVEKEQGIRIVTDQDRKTWYYSLTNEITAYYTLLEKHGFKSDSIDSSHSYIIPKNLALWVSKFEYSNSGKFLKTDTTSIPDFIALMTRPYLSLEEKNNLKITFASNNQVTSFILNELLVEDLVKLSLTEMENCDCFYFNTGAKFKKRNFDSYLSRFKGGTSNCNTEKNRILIIEIQDEISKLKQKFKENN